MAVLVIDLGRLIVDVVSLVAVNESNGGFGFVKPLGQRPCLQRSSWEVGSRWDLVPLWCQAMRG